MGEQDRAQWRDELVKPAIRRRRFDDRTELAELPEPLQKEAAEGSRKLAEADAQARTEFMSLHRDL